LRSSSSYHGVEGSEVEDHVAVEVGVVRAEAGRLAVARGADRDGLAVGAVDRERDARVEDRPVAEPRKVVRHRRETVRHGRDLARDVLRRHRVVRHDSAGLPHERRARGVDDGRFADHAADALRDRLVAEPAQLAHEQVADAEAHAVKHDLRALARPAR
jgi:hypothetical protein